MRHPRLLDIQCKKGRGINLCPSSDISSHSRCFRIHIRHCRAGAIRWWSSRNHCRIRSCYCNRTIVSTETHQADDPKNTAAGIISWKGWFLAASQLLLQPHPSLPHPQFVAAKSLMVKSSRFCSHFILWREPFMCDCLFLQMLKSPLTNIFSLCILL